MKITVLSDNHTDDPRMETEHGLSFYIETKDSCILFDTGQADVFRQNADKLKLDLGRVDYLVLSHGHFDHAGGIGHFLEVNSRARIIMKPQALYEKCKPGKYLGMPKDLHLPEDRVILVDRELELSRDITIIGNITISDDKDTHFKNFYIQSESGLQPDLFEDELFMSVRHPRGIVLITGCSHHGIRNILQTARDRFQETIIAVFGGFHLKDSTREEVENTGAFLKKTRIEKIVTGHCTGFENFSTLRSMGVPDLEYGYAGTSWSINR